jgi:hypothetical protein
MTVFVLDEAFPFLSEDSTVEFRAVDFAFYPWLREQPWTALMWLYVYH